MKFIKKVFRSYNRKEILDIFSNLEISKLNNIVYTKYNGNLISTTSVSDRYEVFNISSYINYILPKLEQNFQINEYFLSIRSGVQILELISDKIEINGISFFKSFYIINSSNKTRALSFNLGLKSNGFYMVGNNLNLYKKHLTGITETSDLITGNIDVESFNEQIESIKPLFNNKVLFSNIRKVILGNMSNSNHKKFDMFKNTIKYGILSPKFTQNQINILNKKSEDINEIDKSDDFYIDAFYVFQIYLSIFRHQDAYIVKKETKKILDITQWAIRNNILEELGI
jgi:hypothetical protein